MLAVAPSTPRLAPARKISGPKPTATAPGSKSIGFEVNNLPKNQWFTVTITVGRRRQLPQKVRSDAHGQLLLSAPAGGTVVIRGAARKVVIAPAPTGGFAATVQTGSQSIRVEKASKDVPLEGIAQLWQGKDGTGRAHVAVRMPAPAKKAATAPRPPAGRTQLQINNLAPNQSFTVATTGAGGRTTPATTVQSDKDGSLSFSAPAGARVTVAGAGVQVVFSPSASGTFKATVKRGGRSFRVLGVSDDRPLAGVAQLWNGKGTQGQALVAVRMPAAGSAPAPTPAKAPAAATAKAPARGQKAFQINNLPARRVFTLTRLDARGRTTTSKVSSDAKGSLSFLAPFAAWVDGAGVGVALTPTATGRYKATVTEGKTSIPVYGVTSDQPLPDAAQFWQGKSTSGQIQVAVRIPAAGAAEAVRAAGSASANGIFRVPPGHIEGSKWVAPGIGSRQATDGILVVGDSLSDQLFYGSKGLGQTWTAQLENLLKDQYEDRTRSNAGPFVQLAALAGSTASPASRSADDVKLSALAGTSSLARLKSAMKLNPKPRAIVLQFGANNWRLRRWDKARGSVFQGFKDMIDYAYRTSPTTRIVVAGVKPPLDYAPGSARQHADFAAEMQRVKQYLESTTAHHAYIEDVLADVKVGGQIAPEFRNLNDPIHPNKAGQSAMMSTIAQQLPLLDRNLQVRTVPRRVLTERSDLGDIGKNLVVTSQELGSRTLSFENLMPRAIGVGASPPDHLLDKVDVRYGDRPGYVWPEDKQFKFSFYDTDGKFISNTQDEIPKFRNPGWGYDVALPAGTASVKIKVLTTVHYTDKQPVTSESFEEPVMTVDLGTSTSVRDFRPGNGELRLGEPSRNGQAIEGSIQVERGGTVVVYRGDLPSAGEQVGGGSYVRLVDGGPGDADGRPDGVIRYSGLIRQADQGVVVFRPDKNDKVNPFGPAVQVVEPDGKVKVHAPGSEWKNDSLNPLDVFLNGLPFLGTGAGGGVAGGAGSGGIGSLGRNTTGGKPKVSKKKNDFKVPKPNPNPFWSALTLMSKAIAAPLQNALRSTDSARNQIAQSSGIRGLPDLVRRSNSASSSESARDAAARQAQATTGADLRNLSTTIFGPGNAGAQAMKKSLGSLATTAAVAGAAAALGKLLKAMGVPILNDGKPATYAVFADVPIAKVKGVDVALSPYVGFSPPGTTVSNHSLSLVVFPKQKKRLGTKVGLLLSYAMDVGDKKVNQGNVGSGPSFVLGGFAYAQAAANLGKSKPVTDAAQAAPSGRGAKKPNVEVTGELDVGAQIRINSNGEVKPAGWGAVAVGLRLDPEKQDGASNKLLAELAPSVSASWTYAPPVLQKPGPKKPASTKPKPTTPGANPTVPTPDDPKVPTKPQKKPVQPPAAAVEVKPNLPLFKSIDVRPDEKLPAEYRALDRVEILNAKGQVIGRSTAPPNRRPAPVVLRHEPGLDPDKYAPQRLRATTRSGKTLQLWFSGAGSTRFGIDRTTAAAKRWNTTGLVAFADSVMGAGVVTLGRPERRTAQPSAVFHVVLPRSAKPGSLRIDSFFIAPTPKGKPQVVQNQSLTDNDMRRDSDGNLGIVKREVQKGTSYRIMVRYTSKKTGKEEWVQVVVDEAGMDLNTSARKTKGKADVSFTGTQQNRKAATGPRVYYNPYDSQTIDLGNLP